MTLSLTKRVTVGRPITIAEHDADATATEDAVNGNTAAITGKQAASSTLTTLSNATAAGLALMDDPDAATQRTTLGLGTLATQDASAVAVTGGTMGGVAITAGTISTLAADLAVADGGTGASTAAAARTALGVDKVERSFFFAGTSIVDGTYTLMRKPAAGITWQGASFASSAGTVTLALQISGTPVTGLDAMAVSSTPDDATASAANVQAVTDTLELVASSNSSAADVDITLHGIWT